MREKQFRGKFTAMQAFLKKQEKFQIKNLIYHLRELEKEQTKPKTRGNKVINVREEINKRDQKTQINSVKSETSSVKG